MEPSLFEIPSLQGLQLGSMVISSEAKGNYNGERDQLGTGGKLAYNLQFNFCVLDLV